MNNDLLYDMQKPLIKEKNGTILDVNDKFLELTQFSKNELCGKYIADALDNLFRCSPKINITDEETQATLFTKTFDVRFVNIKKYTHFDKIENSAHSDKIKNSTHFDNSINLYIFNEIENSRLDNKLLFVENLINDNKIGIGIFTAHDLKLIKANQKYLDYFPKPFNKKEIVYGKCLEEFMPIFKESGGIKFFDDAIKNNKPIYFTEFQDIVFEDNGCWDSTITPVSENGEVKYVMAMLENVTERVLSRKHIQRKNKQQKLIIKAEHEKLKAAEKTLAMKDEFISLISHEFKTPLNVIYSAIQLIEYVYINDIPDKVKGLMKNIKQNTFRQLRLVNNLLDITRLNSGQVKLNIKNIDIVSLTRQISQSVRLYSDQKHIKLLFKSTLDCKNIATDDEKLERIILNLLSNAIKFTDEGGIVTVSLCENEDNNIIVLEVSDTGMGIPKDKQELIFERFGQVNSNLSRHAEGTGIGLSLVKKFVDVLNGKIELESELGNGSTFRITLPINQCIDIAEDEAFLNGDNRLVNALHVEFSDIYL